MVASFQNINEKGHLQLFNEHFGARYVRSENWKLVALPRDSGWHLYDISKDKTETIDLAASNPSKFINLTVFGITGKNASGISQTSSDCEIIQVHICINMEEFFQETERYYALSEACKNEFAGHLKSRFIPKNDFLLRAGEVPVFLWFCLQRSILQLFHF